jgi:signal transduction histidine kinase
LRLRPWAQIGRAYDVGSTDKGVPWEHAPPPVSVYCAGMRVRREWHPRTLDAALAVGLATSSVIAAVIAPEGARDVDAVGFLLVASSALVLVGRRSLPVTVLVGSMAFVLVYQVRGYADLAPLPVFVAVYTAVRARRGRLTLAIAAVGLVLGILASLHSRAPDETTTEVVQGNMLIVGWLVAAGVLAMTARHREAYVEQAEQRVAEAERTREEAALRRAGEERLRIARELHDSLTHNISIIKVQAGVAVHLARKRGEEVPDALLAIQEASRDAVRELRATLDVLRQPGGDAESSGHRLDRLDALLDRTRLAGVPATLTVVGDARTLPVDVDQAAYRIVQEALTNVSRHAGTATAEVRVEYGPDSLTLQVDDDGAARAGDPPVPGVGLIGMRERVTALGGRLRAEPRTDGGFMVRAELPLRREATPVGGEPAAEGTR